MTGDEHYREAERLISDEIIKQAPNERVIRALIAEAQVHATLAIADQLGRIVDRP